MGRFLPASCAIEVVMYVFQKSEDRQAPLEGPIFKRRRFTRRADLTNSVRLAIAQEALHAMMNGIWNDTKLQMN